MSDYPVRVFRVSYHSFWCNKNGHLYVVDSSEGNGRVIFVDGSLDKKIFSVDVKNWLALSSEEYPLNVDVEGNSICPASWGSPISYFRVLSEIPVEPGTKIIQIAKASAPIHPGTGGARS